MRPVVQTQLYTPDGLGNGNCLAAALASLLELPLWMVPPFDQMFARSDSYSERMQDWLEKFFGLELIYRPGHKVSDLPEFYIARGLSPRGVFHAVIYSAGKLVHDPHFSGSGIAEVDGTWHLVPLKKTALPTDQLK